MTTPTNSEAIAPFTVDGPVCDAPATLDADAGVLACAAYSIRVELAPDDAPALELAA